MRDLNFHRRLSIAPMLDYTDRHERRFLRLLSKNVLLYTEMIAANALVHAEPSRFLKHDPSENPVALQLGGSDPAMLVEAAKMVEGAGFDEVNLNCGCPSERVQSGAFGACLMREKDRVAECVFKMGAAVKIPVTVKTRIGVDNDDSWAFFFDFVKTVADAGCDTFIIHARKAWLKGLSPKENREVPPLRYDFVYKLKEEMPRLNVSLNGGVRTMDAVLEHLQHVDGVMAGREPYENPWFLIDADSRVFGAASAPAYGSRKELLEAYFPYVESELADGCPLNIITRHLFGIFDGIPGARRYRQILSSEAPREGAGLDVLKRAMTAVQTTP